uniref:Myosin-binding protein C, fast-type n=1 Tax=Hucho hucho TaxID=62062 RepID=A0A4W5R7J7_9TELE
MPEAADAVKPEGEGEAPAEAEEKTAEDDEVLPEGEEEAHQSQEITGLFLQHPETTVAVTGTDIVFTAKVDSTTLSRKPTIKWLKGKWLDLGSKAGKHMQFKETFDRATKIYTWDMKIIKVVPGDAGAYRCEVTSKDKCDSSAFDISVEGEDAGEDEGSLDFSALLKKKPVVDEEKADVWEILKNAQPSEYEKIAFEYGITDLRGLLKRLKKMKTVEPKHSDAFLKRMESAYSVDKGKKIVLEVEVVDPNAQVKWLKNGQEIKSSAKYIIESVGNIRTLTINRCSLADDAAYECVIGEEKSFTEVFVKEPPVTITKLLDDYHVVVGERVEFEVEVSVEGAHVNWMFEDQELSRDSHKYRFKKDGMKHMLIIQEASLDDIGMYWCFTNGGRTKGELDVEEKELEVLQNIADLTVKAEDQAMFKCEVSDEKVTGKWLKDGVEVLPSSRIKLTHIGRIHRLTIDEVKPEDAGDYTFIPDGYALSLSAKLNFLEIKIDYVPRQDPPKIHLDTTGNMVSKNTIIVVAGNKLRLDVEISGEPPPTVVWAKGDTVGTSYTLEGRVRTENRKDLSCFVIEGAEREDEGNYSITVTNPAGEDKANLFVKIVDVPDCPENVKCTSVGEDCATMVWEPPKFDGGVPVTGYLMERKKKGSTRWTKLNFDVFEGVTYEAKRMIEGVLYEMRVYAVNGIGMSQPSLNSKPFMPIAATSEPLGLKVHDVTDTTCTLKWLAPEKIGAGGLDGYVIEYCKEGGEGVFLRPVSNTIVYHCQTSCIFVKSNLLLSNLIYHCQTSFITVKTHSYLIQGQTLFITLSKPIYLELPKIRLPRYLRQKYLRRVGDKINLTIPFQGKPRPKVQWYKDGEELDVRVASIRNSEVDSILFIRSAERSHSGKYELVLQIENMEARAILEIRIVETPGPPEVVKVTDVWGFNAALEWKPPKDDGNCEITGYTIQKADKKTNEWFTIYDHNRRTNCTASDLIMGNEYMFRVFSENLVGKSEDFCLSKDTAIIPKIGLEYNPPPFKEKDMQSAPKFIQPLLDRSVVAGYSTAISCAVRGFPKPKIRWLRNKIPLDENPRFLMQNNQGVLTLNIRKPSQYDGGKFTCKAINPLGEDVVECTLLVRDIFNIFPQS